ncbi:ribosome silencing factor [Rariglobus hedericola]|uniref:Ribosomal silencing factor RsfS n=1 Tax=Rariglobus hedericola TaxID=2597822 RepID=A0A556QRW8_9BACT|nr:ribosome silencing factor [Rariglobus hedericola]TSJ79363.1 ribosome silencing factor [Rariglobus hedericola]
MSNTLPSDSTFLLLKQLVRALDEKKVGDLRVLKVSAKSTITDYIVLATGNSEPHLRALRIEVERVLDEVKHPIAGMEVGTYGSGWTVVDAYQIMTHLFTPEQRANYALEKLWKDAEVLNVAALVAQPKVDKPAAKKAVKKKAVVKKTASKTKVSVKKAPAKKKTVTVAKKPVAKKKAK